MSCIILFYSYLQKATVNKWNQVDSGLTWLQVCCNDQFVHGNIFYSKLEILIYWTVIFCQFWLITDTFCRNLNSRANCVLKGYNVRMQNSSVYGQRVSWALGQLKPGKKQSKPNVFESKSGVGRLNWLMCVVLIDPLNPFIHLGGARHCIELLRPGLDDLML